MPRDDHYQELEARYRATGDTRAMGDAQLLVELEAREQGFLPLPFYHGSKATFTEFQWSKMGLNATAMGKGFYFTNDEALAQSYANDPEGSLIKAFLMDAPPISDERLTLRPKKIRLLLERMEHAIGDEGEVNPIDNYGGLNEAASILSNSQTDVELIADLIGGGCAPEMVYAEWQKFTGH
jgi:hypothetical protein